MWEQSAENQVEYLVCCTNIIWIFLVMTLLISLWEVLKYERYFGFFKFLTRGKRSYGTQGRTGKFC